MRVLVTGGTGFIGRHLVAHLLESGHSVVVLARETYGMGFPFPPPLSEVRQQFHAVYADLRNFRLTARAVEEAAADAVCHLAAVGVTDPFLPVDTAVRHNVSGTLNLLRACFEKRHMDGPFVVARTPGEQQPSNTYAASKAAAWQFCDMYSRSEGWPIRGATIFQAYGSHQPPNTLIPSAARAALDGEPFPMTSGEQKKDWIYIRDVVQGLVAVLETEVPPGATVELGTGQATSVRAVVQKIFALVNGEGRPQPGTLPDRPGEPREQIADSERTRAMLDWQARYTLDDGLKEFLATFSR
jgi:nucleoside-diphosphate-sugar epimerase